ncbi:VOC family protein [Haloactinopolyspora alba]|nr:VOC family protein [Haloactinopolyspora alba]
MSETTLMPRLVVAGADQAIEFYRTALGAQVLNRYAGPDGAVVHAELRVGSTKLSLKDEDGTDRSAATLGGSPVMFTLDVPDADAVADAMQRAGATVVFAVHDTTYGYRQGRLTDPFGFQWILSQSIEELTEAQRQERIGG